MLLPSCRRRGKNQKYSKEGLRSEKKEKKRIWFGKVPGKMSELEYFSLFSGYYSTEKAGYRIYWFHSSEKKKNDHLRRGHRLEKAERALLNLMLRLNKRKLKTREEIEAQIEKILKKHKVNSFYEISLTAYYR